MCTLGSENKRGKMKLFALALIFKYRRPIILMWAALLLVFLVFYSLNVQQMGFSYSWKLKQITLILLQANVLSLSVQFNSNVLYWHQKRCNVLPTHSQGLQRLQMKLEMKEKQGKMKDKKTKKSESWCPVSVVSPSSISIISIKKLSETLFKYAV